MASPPAHFLPGCFEAVSRTRWDSKNPVLGVGELGEFKTSEPPWFGSTGDEPAEVLSVFGRARRGHAFSCGPVEDPRTTGRATLVIANPVPPPNGSSLTGVAGS